MSKEDVIINDLQHIKDGLDKLEAALQYHSENQCQTCQNAPAFRERLRSQWFHIVSLWGAMAIIGSALWQHAAK